MPSTDPVAAFDDYLLLEIFGQLAPQDVVRAGYNVSRAWRHAITRLKLCKRIFFALPNVGTADPYVLERRALGDKRFGDDDIDWRAHCVANIIQEDAWADGRGVLRWSPDIIDTGIWYGRTYSVELVSLDRQRNTLLFIMQTSSRIPVSQPGYIHEDTKQLHLIDAKTLTPVWDPRVLPSGEYKRAFVLDVLGHVLCRHLTGEHGQDGEDGQPDEVQVWVTREAMAYFGTVPEVTDEDEECEIPGFRHLVSFSLPYATDTLVTYELSVESDAGAVDLLLLKDSDDGERMVVSRIASTVVDESRLQEKLQEIDLAPMPGLAVGEEVDFGVGMGMDKHFVMRTADAVQVYSRATNRFVMSIPAGLPGERTMFPAAVAYDLAEAVRSASVSVRRARTYALPPTGKPLIVQGSMRGLLPGSVFESPRMYHKVTSPIIDEGEDDNQVDPSPPYIAGNDMVIVYDWFGVQVIKEYQAVFLRAEAMEADEREAFVARNSIFIGYCAPAALECFDVACSGTRVVISRERETVVLDTATMTLAAAPITATFIYDLAREELGPTSNPCCTALSPTAFYEIVPLNQVQERQYRAAARRDTTMTMTPWHTSWTATHCPNFVQVNKPEQPSYGLRVVEFGAQRHVVTAEERRAWLYRRASRVLEVPSFLRPFIEGTADDSAVPPLLRPLVERAKAVSVVV
ncbi:hypothetical protein Q8F55_008445 [Vanrija albida]|uniref:F-box domain-containing protein n=1 Tax=Vanrija albida TaxID=181172 RepID=A0ABR3PQV3_9TREE